MPTMTLTDEPLQISAALRRALDESGIATASHAVKVYADKAAPALILIVEGELAFVTRHGVKCWAPAALLRVDRNQIVPVTGEPVRIAGWEQVSRREPFLYAVRDLLGQPQPSSPPSPIAATTPGSGKARAVVVAVLMGIIVTLALATLNAYLSGSSSQFELFSATVVASFVLGIPLLVSSIRLAARDSRWRPLSIAGILVGGAGIAAFALSVLFVIAWGVACGGEGCLR